MTVIGYMDAAGVFRESVQEGSNPRGQNLILAPDGWGHGLRWTGTAWVEHVDLELSRQDMVADKWQLVAILDLMDPALWQRIEGYAAGTVDASPLPPCDPITRSAIRNAITIPRLSQIVDLLAYLLGWDADEVDELFRRAMELRG